MPNIMPDQEDTKIFCDHCRWVFKCWTMNLGMHSAANDPTITRLCLENKLRNSAPGQFLDHYFEISGPYTVLQIAKLHDPAESGDHRNLSIKFFVDQDAIWLPDEKEELDSIRTKLNNFYEKYIRQARHKIIAHNDRDMFRDGSFCRKICENDSNEYMSKLGELADMIWKKWDCSEQQSFDFSPMGQLGQRYVSIARTTVGCIQFDKS